MELFFLDTLLCSAPNLSRRSYRSTLSTPFWPTIHFTAAPLHQNRTARLHKEISSPVMAPSPKPDHHLNLNYLPQLSATQPPSGSSTGNTSPVEPPAGNVTRIPFNNNGNSTSMATPPGIARLGAGSPSLELGVAGRLYSKR